MKLILLISVFISGLAAIGQSTENDIVGIWITQVKDAKIEIYKKNNLYYGKVVWIQSPNDAKGKPKVDGNNPDVNLKNRSILGMNIITNMTFSGNEWSGGKIYDPKNGETYTCKLWLENGSLKVRGYLGWFYDTKTWHKVG